MYHPTWDTRFDEGDKSLLRNAWTRVAEKLMVEGKGLFIPLINLSARKDKVESA